MASLEITEVLARVKKLPAAVADRAVEVMKQEVPHYTWHLASTVRKTKMADGSYSVGTHDYVGGGIYGIREVGAIVRAGRKELWPRYAKALEFDPPPGWGGPIDPVTGLAVIRHANAVDPTDAEKNGGKDFVERTRDKVESEIQSIWNSL